MKFTAFAIALIPALSMTSAFAESLNKAQLRALNTINIARYAGLDNHCPRYRLIESAMYAELSEAGITPSGDDFETANTISIMEQVRQHVQNPSEFCAGAWHMLGPSGTYKRQMLEAN